MKIIESVFGRKKNCKRKENIVKHTADEFYFCNVQNKIATPFHVIRNAVFFLFSKWCQSLSVCSKLTGNVIRDIESSNVMESHAPSDNHNHALRQKHSALRYAAWLCEKEKIIRSAWSRSNIILFCDNFGTHLRQLRSSLETNLGKLVTT